MAATALNTSAFMAKLLAPVPGVFTPDMFTDADLSSEENEIAEAREKVTTFKRRRDTAAWGTRAQAVQQIMLDWWENELRSLTGGLAA